MPKNFTVNVNGQDYAKLQTILQQFSDCEQQAAIDYGLNKAMEPVIQKGKANLASRNKVYRGNLSSSFGKKIDKKSGKKIYAGFKRPKGAHSHLVDRGTKQRFTKAGASRGKMPGSKFWTDAVMDSKPQQTTIMSDAIKDALSTIVKHNGGTP